jgi:hypothetical protein
VRRGGVYLRTYIRTAVCAGESCVGSGRRIEGGAWRQFPRSRNSAHEYPSQAAEWIFPADSDSGHLVEQKEDRATLPKWRNDLRQSFRTIAATAGVSEFDAKLLMNHAIPGVNAGTSPGINSWKITSAHNNNG